MWRWWWSCSSCAEANRGKARSDVGCGGGNEASFMQPQVLRISWKQMLVHDLLDALSWILNKHHSNKSRIKAKIEIHWIHAPVLVLDHLDHVPLLCAEPSPCSTVYSASSGPVLLCRNGNCDIYHHSGIHLWCCVSRVGICPGCEAPALQRKAKASFLNVARDGSSLTCLKYLLPHCQSLTGYGNQRNRS